MIDCFFTYLLTYYTSKLVGLVGNTHTLFLFFFTLSQEFTALAYISL